MLRQKNSIPTLVLSVYLVWLSQLYAYSYCTYKRKLAEQYRCQSRTYTVLTTENFFQCWLKVVGSFKYLNFELKKRE